jgi:ribonuclease D
LGYAVNDTRFLKSLAERLGGELSGRGRLEWHSESCRAMVESTGRESSRDPGEAWRIKGAGRLSRRQLVYLRELWRWRDEHARSANVPAFKVFGNRPILELVQWAESHPGAPLRQGPKVPRNVRGARLRTLEEAIARAAGMPPAQWPTLRIQDRANVLPVDRKESFDALRRECERLAGELKIAPSTLAPRAALEALARTRSQNLDEIMKSGGLLRWQAELMRGAVEKYWRSTASCSGETN